jgi:purine-binding chemotaxis protein CheW
MPDTHQLCTFFVGDLFVGVDVLEVQEVLRFRETAPVPLAPAMVEGLINLRGQIVTAIDLRRRMALPPRGPDRLPVNVILRTDDGAVSLLVDEIGDVIEVDDKAFEALPATLAPGARELMRGVYKLQGRLLLVLDPAAAVTLPAGA